MDTAFVGRLSPHVRGHLIQFDERPAPTYSDRVGTRLITAAVLLEIGRLAALRWTNAGIPLWLLVSVLLALALASIRWSGLALSEIGLRAWRDWSATERSYFAQILIIANILFPLVFAAPLRARLAQGSLGWALSSVFLPYLIFGFYQEVVYRGILQLELVRRFGAVAGILVANLLYTFGPLHAYYFAARGSVAVPMFAAIFGIGLLFGIVFRRSGNLWIVAVMHGIGNAYIVGSLGRIV